MELGETLESYLNGKQEIDLAGALKENQESRENVVELAYHLLIANPKLKEEEAIKQANTYFTLRKNLKEIIQTLEAYAEASKALASEESPEEISKLVSDLERELKQAEQHKSRYARELPPFHIAANYQLQNYDKGSRKAFKKFLRERKLNERRFNEKYRDLVKEETEANRKAKELKQELSDTRLVLESAEKRNDILLQRQRRKDSVNRSKLEELYDSLFTQKSLPALPSEPKKPDSEQADVMKHAFTEVRKLGEHAIDKIAEVSQGDTGRKIIEVRPELPALPAKTKKLKMIFSPEERSRVEQIIVEYTGLSANNWLGRLKKDPAETAKSFLEKFGDKMEPGEDEVFYT